MKTLTAKQELIKQLKKDKYTSIMVGHYIMIFPESDREQMEKKAIYYMEKGHERKNKDGTTTRREFDPIMVKRTEGPLKGHMDYVWDKTGNKIKHIVWEEVWKDGKRLSKKEVRTVWKKF